MYFNACILYVTYGCTGSSVNYLVGCSPNLESLRLLDCSWVHQDLVNINNVNNNINNFNNNNNNNNNNNQPLNVGDWNAPNLRELLLRTTLVSGQQLMVVHNVDSTKKKRKILPGQFKFNFLIERQFLRDKLFNEE